MQYWGLNFGASRHGSALYPRCGVQEGNALHDVMRLALVKSCRVWCWDWMCHKHVHVAVAENCVSCCSHIAANVSNRLPCIALVKLGGGLTIVVAVMWLSRKCQRNGGEKGGRSVLFRLVLGPPGIIWGCEDFAVRAPWMLPVKELHDDHYRFGLAD